MATTKKTATRKATAGDTARKATAKKASAKKATAKKTTAKKATAKKATAKKTAASGADTKKLERQLAKLETQLEKFRKDQAELKKEARELGRLQKQLEKTDLELENFKDWTRTYFEQITEEFNRLAATGKLPADAPTPRAAPARSDGELREEFEEIRRWVKGSYEELSRALEEVRDQERTTRTTLDDMRNRWQPVGWHELPPDVL